MPLCEARQHENADSHAPTYKTIMAWMSHIEHPGLFCMMNQKRALDIMKPSKKINPKIRRYQTW